MYKPCINQLNYGAPLCAPQTARIDVTATSRAVWAPRTTAPSDGPGRPLATKRGGCGEWIGGLAWNPVLRGSSNFRDDFSRSPEDFFLKGDFYHNLWGILAGTSQRSFFCSRTESCGWFPHLKNIRSIAALVVLNLEKPRKFLSHFSLGFTGRFDPDSSGAQRFMEEQRKFNPKPTRKQFEAGGNIRIFTLRKSKIVNGLSRCIGVKHVFIFLNIHIHCAKIYQDGEILLERTY